MSNLQPSSSASWFIKLVPTITTVCVTLGAVAIYDYQTNKPIQLNNEVSSGTSQIPGPQGSVGDIGATGLQGVAGPTGSKGAKGPAGPAGPKGDTGATGAQGPAGSSGSGGGSGLVLRDATGAVIEGPSYREANYNLVNVFQNGALFTVDMATGIFYPFASRGSAYYPTADCSGLIVGSINNYKNETLQIQRDVNGTLVDITGVFKVGDVRTGAVYVSNYPGDCFQSGDNSYKELTPVTLPSNRPAPLYFSPN